MLLNSAIVDYYVHMSDYPESLEDLANPPLDGGPTEVWRKHGPFLKYPAPKDPWGRKYIYTIEDGQVRLRSSGPDRKPNTADDVSNEPPAPQ